MIDRVGQVWEAKGAMNGDRIVVIVSSRPVRGGTQHQALHLSGKREGRIVEWNEDDDLCWEKTTSYNRLV
jgi:hypothetical protein